jgi:hypothetical protein
MEEALRGPVCGCEQIVESMQLTIAVTSFRALMSVGSRGERDGCAYVEALASREDCSVRSVEPDGAR